MQGEKNPFFGHSHSAITKEKISVANTGRPHTMEWKKNMSKRMTGVLHPQYGKIVTEETRLKMRIARLGRTPWNKGKVACFSQQTLAQMSRKRIGKKTTDETRKKIGLAHMGEKNWRWIHDRSQLKKYDVRNDPASYDWAMQVKKRDGWKCRIADNTCNGKIVAHHILPWAAFPNLRYNLNNGIALCHHHHPRKRNEEMELSPYFQSLVNQVHQLGN